MKKAVLFITFTRLDYAKKVLEAISKAKPPRLYIASDGPRPDKAGEKEKVEAVREYILEHIDWKCDVKTRFLETNSGGAAQGVSGAITWFFENEPDGIILEEDEVPNQSFFIYCEELLDKYRDDKRIWHITGDAPIEVDVKDSYYFAKIEHCWGWATWADRWKNYSLDISDLPKNVLEKFSAKTYIQKYWQKIWKELNEGKIDTWDYQWTFIIVNNDGLCINPTQNLVTNIGVDGMHYKGAVKDKDLQKKTFELQTIIHPQKIELNEHLVERIYKEKFNLMEGMVKYQRKFYLFSILPIYTIKKKNNISRHYLFGFIPLIQVKDI